MQRRILRAGEFYLNIPEYRVSSRRSISRNVTEHVLVPRRFGRPRVSGFDALHAGPNVIGIPAGTLRVIVERSELFCKKSLIQSHRVDFNARVQEAVDGFLERVRAAIGHSI